MTEQWLAKQQRLLAAARGERPADLVLTGAQVANLYTGEWRREEVAVSEGIIVGVGPDYAGPRLEVSGYLVPGFIDGHLHLESSMLTPGELARALVPRGTTAVVADPHEIVNVWGSRGLDYLLHAVEGLPLDFFFMLPSCVPASPLSSAGARWDAADLAPYLNHPRVLGLAEVMNYPGVVAGDRDLLEKIALFPRGPVDGHAPLLTGKALQAYRLAGIGSDHECTTLAEAREKLGLGFHLMIREGSLAKNLADLLPALTPATQGRISLVSDDLHPEDLARRGHLDHLLRRAVAEGLEPLQAVALVTRNTARYFGLQDRGALAPGMRADLVLVQDLKEFRVEKVWKDGKLVAERGSLLPGLEIPSYPAHHGALRVAPLEAQVFSPPVTGELVRVIGLIPGQILTAELIVPAPVRDGRLAALPAVLLAGLHLGPGERPVSDADVARRFLRRHAEGDQRTRAGLRRLQRAGQQQGDGVLLGPRRRIYQARQTAGTRTL